MLEGKRPAECSYCWKIEDIGRDNIADRIFFSRIYKEEDIGSDLKYLPMGFFIFQKLSSITSFDRVCNFVHTVIGYSTTWGKDIDKTNLSKI